MPTSEHWQIPVVVDVLARQRPRTVLDVGTGYGKYGVLVREYSTAERVDGIDVSPPRFHAYDNFFRGDIRQLDTLLPADAPHYDLALFIDTIEHLEKAEAWRVLEMIAARASKVLVATPFGFRRQDIPGMPYETHRSGWYPWEFRKRYRVHAVRVFPGQFSTVFRVPRLWQLLVLLSPKPADR